MSFQKPRAVSACCWPFGNIPVSLPEQEFGFCSTDCRGHTWDGHLQDWQGWLFPCSGCGLLWPGIAGSTSGGLLFPQHRVLTMAHIQNFGTKDGILAFSTRGSCISSLFGPFVLSSSAATSVAPAPSPAGHSGLGRAGGRSREHGEAQAPSLPSSISGKVTLRPCIAMVLIPHRN